MRQWIIGDLTENKKSIFFWNSVGGAVSAGQSAIILVFISHKMSLTIAGMVVIAYAVASIFASLTRYGIRNYQVKDSNNTFLFKDYLYCRLLCAVLSCLICIGYFIWCITMNGDTISKIFIMGEITILKIIDAIEDVYLGRYQQTDHFLAGAKIMAVRLLISTFLMCIFICIGIDIYYTLLAGIAVSLVIDFYLIHTTFHITMPESESFKLKQIIKLMKKCFPLCIGTTLSIYIGNVPKYMIDMYMDETVQAIFGYIMMPVFIVMLLNTFIYQPMIKELGDVWNRKQELMFKKMIIRQCIIVAVMAAIVIAGGMLVGLPILSMIYNVELSVYRVEFFVLLLGGGAYALAYYLNVPITTIRRQGYIALGYIMATACSLVFGKYFVIQFGMLGAALLYLLINFLIVVINSIVLVFGVKRRGNSGL